MSLPAPGIDVLAEFLGVLALAFVLAWQVLWTATRLDRLHGRVDGARAALDAQLVRRATITVELATSGMLDPASSLLLADAAHRAAAVDGEDREMAESDLSRALRAALDAAAVVDLRAQPAGAAVLDDLAAAWMRAGLARRFFNDAVRGATVLRRARVVRLLRLAGHAPLLPTFEIDDEPPEALQS